MVKRKKIKRVMPIVEEPVYKAMPAPVVLYNWTGFYVGGNVGYSWGRSNFDYAHDAVAGHFGDPPGGLFNTSAVVKGNSPIAGAQIGYNQQYGNVVAGLEFDIAWRREKDNSISEVLNQFADRFTLATSERKWLGTGRARLGWASDRLLSYATGGLAVGRFEHSLSQASNLPVSERTVSDTDTKFGWTLGAGMEYAFGANWSLGAEYLYTKFRSTDLQFAQEDISGLIYPVTDAKFSESSQMVRGKVNYRF